MKNITKILTISMMLSFLIACDNSTAVKKNIEGESTKIQADAGKPKYATDIPSTLGSGL